MGKGSYNGGSTIAGRWSDSTEFPGFERDDPSISSSTHYPITRSKRRELADQQALREAEELARSLDLGRDEALERAARPALPRRFKERAIALKALVKEGFLLPSGVPNPSHPELVEWVSRRKSDMKRKR